MNSGISILIRTFNSAGTLPTVLERLELQPADEILVVDSGSTDATLAIAKKHRVRILIAAPPFNYSKSLNLGLRAAKNPWVLVLSSHCLPQSRDLLEIFRRATAQLPAHVVVAYGDSPLIPKKVSPDEPALLIDRTTPPGQWQGYYSGNRLALYRRAHWEKYPFDESLPTAEDLAWALQALENDNQLALVSQACVLYRNQASLCQMFRKGRIEAQTALKIAGHRNMGLSGFCLILASLGKKLLLGQIPPTVFLRMAAHALGAFWS